MHTNRYIFDLERGEIAHLLEGQPAFRADQIFDWLYKKQVNQPEAMTNLSKELRRFLSDKFSFDLPEIAEKKTASDETEKYRLLLADKRSLECVMMPDLRKAPGERGVSMCISSQVGCALKCDFCATGTMGLVRDLTPGEIVAQVVLMLREMDYEPTRINIIYMGMGEPLLNLANVIKSLTILNDELGLAIPMRRITVSTAGIPKGMQAIFNMAKPPRLALSLHAPHQELREKLMPISRKYTLEQIVDLCRSLPFTMRDYLTFEYILLREVNDRPEHARQLAALVQGIHAKVNLIPHNKWDGVPYDEPDEDSISKFMAELTTRDVTATVRRSRGRDADAACGQLAVKNQKKRHAI
jgi:23S rRNA (adenine2503-C2)-methyltransferase